MNHLRIGHLGDAETLVKKFHYSHRMPANIQLCATLHADGGLLGDFGEAIAACIFSLPPTRWSIPVWELSRLVRDEGHKPILSKLIADVCAHIRRNKLANLLVSFADWTQHHHGGIYQAASWEYAGKRDRRMDGVLWRGSFIPGRSCNSRWGTRSPTLLGKMGVNVEPHYDEGKLCYWRALNRAGKKQAATLDLKSLPYPKPNKQTEMLEAAE